MPTLKDFANAAFGDEPQPANDADGYEAAASSGVPQDHLNLTWNGKSQSNGGAPAEEPEKTHAPGMRCESKRLYEKENELGTSDWVEEMPSNFREANPFGNEWTEYALVLRTQLVEGQQRLHSIVVQSPLLKAALKLVFTAYPGVFVGKTALTVEAPFKPFVHRWELFTELCAKEKNSELKGHLGLLKEALEPELQEAFAVIADFKSQGAIEYKQLWMIFKPGSVVFSPQSGADNAYQLVRTETRLSKEEKREFFLLHVAYVDFDGKRFGLALHMLAVGDYQGSMTCGEMGVHPLDYHPEKGSIVRRLTARGRKFEALADVIYKAYDGPAVDNTQMRPSKHYTTGRIVIDAATYLRFNPQVYVSLAPVGGGGGKEVTDADLDEEYKAEAAYAYDPMYMDHHRIRGNAIMGATRKQLAEGKVKLTEEHLLLCRDQVRGYSLKLKKWLDFSVDSVKEIKWNDKAFDSLALPGNYKNLLYAFARNQQSSAAKFDDVIEGKGRGMVMLLEGPPGVGKTLTAESVTEQMKAPLYSITAGQLGTSAVEVQQRLTEAFEIAAAWKAVVLLDEADIFLEKRGLSSLTRNQLVSVFLQSLEYFEGTIFLTTNRVQCIDPAFESRIHLSLTYPELDNSARHKVWRNFVDSLQVDTSKIDDATIERFASAELNGRQIKNIVKMAGLLAIDSGSVLKSEHVDTIMKISSSRLTDQ